MLARLVTRATEMRTGAYVAHCTPGLAFYQRMMDKDHKARAWNQERRRELRRSGAYEVEIFCAHDVAEFERLSGRSAEIPADRIVPRGRAGSVADLHALGD